MKLGFSVSPRTIRKYLGRQPRTLPAMGWIAFLKAHAPSTWACDWLRVYTITSPTLYVFVVLAHLRRRVVHFHVTDQPSDIWVAQQLVEATAFGEAPRWLLRDGDPLYGTTFKQRTVSTGIRTLRIPKGRPQCNCYVERLIRTLRRECLNQLIILNERHLLSLLREYIAYYHRARPHQGLGQETPLPRPEPLSREGAIRSRPILGALHHDYFRLAG